MSECSELLMEAEEEAISIRILSVTILILRTNAVFYYLCSRQLHLLGAGPYTRHLDTLVKWGLYSWPTQYKQMIPCVLCILTRKMLARAIYLIASSVNQRFVYCQRVEDEKIIGQTVGMSKVCDQRGDRVS